MPLRWVAAFATVGTLAACAACSSGTTHATAEASSSGSSSSGNGGASGASSTSGAGGHDATTGAGGSDAGSEAHDASIDTGPGDGTPTRQTCTSKFGSAVTSTHGRMDGFLVSIVPPENSSQCNADTGHVHLQLQVNGSIYDVAVNTDTLYDVIDVPLLAPAWSEGWHPNLNLDYPTSLSVHSSSFTTSTDAAIAQMIETDLATANHLSVYATGYGPTGIHDVHREGSDADGAIVIDPLSTKPKWLLFRFTTDSF